MKSRRLIQNNRPGRCLGPLTVLCAVSAVYGAETNAPPQEAAALAAALTPEQMFEGGTNTFNNWVEVSAGGFITSGNKAEFRQQQQKSGNVFGGIQDLHFQEAVAKGTTFSLDGRALFDENDYKLKLDVTKEKLGYLRFSYSEFQTWYNGDGGYFSPSQAYYALPGNGLALDRGEISFEAGLRLDKWPSVTFKYTHETRDGDKGSTSWGPVHPASDAQVRGISPSVLDIDETRDIFQLDATHHIKATDFGVGVRYESGKQDDARKMELWRGEPIDQKITDRQGTSYDLFNVHAFSETWIKKNLLLSAGLSYSDLNNDFSGSRIYGSDFDVGYVPGAQNGFGYYGLNGGSQLHEYVMDLNLLFKPSTYWSIVPSVRVQKEDTDANSHGMETFGTAAATPFNANSESDVLDVRERLDVTYNGITNWVLYARGELTEGQGNLNENGGTIPINGIGVPGIQRETDDNRFFQKYSAGARWYPARSVTVDFGGYYKNNKYDYDHETDSTPNNSANRYPAYLVMNNFETYDGNARLTLRPLRNVTMVSRYEYQWNTIHTRPDPVSGLSEAEASKMTSQIFAQDISWSPWSRLYLQAGFNYVLSETETPASDYTQAILDAQNNYWTLNFSAGLVLDDKTDLNVGYFYYQADNYQDNSEYGLPLGASGQEHGVTATLVRRLSKNLRLTCKYGYYQYDDGTYGGNRDYSAHVLYSSLQYRF
jgi:hypothetical protein